MRIEYILTTQPVFPSFLFNFILKDTLFLQRNGTLEEVSTIYTGHSDMKEFGLLNRLNGMDRLPYWPDAPCNSIRASEGKNEKLTFYAVDICIANLCN